jgi:GTP-binding protein EngB required for normal cell division
MTRDGIPEFAVVGHPNEGKSAVVSTLAEDDRVRVTPYPGETLMCQTFPVVIDGKEIIRFTDTPGFQSPKRSLAWMKGHEGPEGNVFRDFLEHHQGDPDFKDDCELLKPIAEGAGIIYVVDGSRPVRNVDLAEMEILRLTGRPRMAIINCKEDKAVHLEQWKSEFRKHFNAIRVFNANKATYAERIDLLENLKGIDQDWAPALETVISAFREDWQQRNALTADIICHMLESCLDYSVTRNYTERSVETVLSESLQQDFNRAIHKIEGKAHQRIRRLFKHNIFNLDLPAHSILNEALFNEKTWQLLGLTPKQLITASGMAGGAIGAALDVAAAGLTFGVFTAIGGLLGAGWAALGGKRLSKVKVKGLNLGGKQIRVGPIRNVQFLYVLLDRALIFYAHIINWAHGRRDYPDLKLNAKETEKAGLTSRWDDQGRGFCQSFYNAVRSRDDARKALARKALKNRLQEELLKISQSEDRYGIIPPS